MPLGVDNITILRPSIRRENLVGSLFIVPALCLLILLIGYPVLYTIVLSFTQLNYFAQHSQFVGLQNYVQVLRDPAFWKAFKTNVIWTIFSVMGQLVMGLGVALLVSEESRVNKGLRTVYLIPYVIPVIVTAFTWRWLLADGYGILTNVMLQLNLWSQIGGSPLANVRFALPTVILVNIWRGFPFAMVTYCAALQAIPQEEREAARIDGANALQEFIWITVPHLKQVTVTLVLLRSIWVFNYFDLVYLLTGGGPAGATEHLPILVYVRAMGQYQFGYAATVAVLMTLVLSIMMVPYINLWRRTQIYQ